MLPFKQSILACLLTVMLLSACSPAKTPISIPVLANTKDPLETKAVCVNIAVSNSTVKVGEVVSVTGTLVGVVKPNYYGLEIRDDGADDSSMLVNVLLPGPIKAADVSQIVKMASASYADGKAVLGLEARAVGATTIDFFVSAEDFCGTPLGSGISSKIKITVTP